MVLDIISVCLIVKYDVQPLDFITDQRPACKGSGAGKVQLVDLDDLLTADKAPIHHFSYNNTTRPTYKVKDCRHADSDLRLAKNVEASDPHGTGYRKVVI